MKKIIQLIIYLTFFIGIIFSIIDNDNLTDNKSNIISNKKLTEKDYVNMYCTGIKEYVLEDKTRVDCLTDEYAIEFDYAKKWAESIGQSLYYSKKTGKKPAVAIITNGENDLKYIQRIKETDEKITIFEIPANIVKNNKE
ncbi:TPA: hypothetical protein IAA87_04095 [Candidatus Avigastranaerophilus faecigallinarum]|nr:hypothetical protein [Candidatus Avigastranaerophilus faecigallinarum]